MSNDSKNTIEKNLNTLEGSFIYTLHDENSFDEKGFFELVKSISHEKDIAEKESKNLINIFLYVLKTFIYHFDSADLSELSNFEQIQDKVACYVELSEYCILGLSPDSEISLTHINNIINEYLE